MKTFFLTRKSCAALLISLLSAAAVFAEEILMKDGARAWSDREQFLISGLPAELAFTKPVPQQRCSAREIAFPPGTRRALIGLYDCPETLRLAERFSLTPCGGSFRAGGLQFKIYMIENPPEKLDCQSTKAGGILLTLDDDVPPPAGTGKKNPLPGWKGLEQMQEFPGQEYSFAPGPRQVKMFVREPAGGVNADTGLMLLLHNWGGTWQQTVPWCNVLADRYNLITVSVDYLQSGESAHERVPYDHGLLQAMDCLRAVHVIDRQLKKARAPWNPGRLYAAGGSGGGNVSQMVNKLAPSSFACVIDICGMPGLTDDIAFGRGNLNAGYSDNPESPKFLTPAMREIRDPGNLTHLKNHKKVNPHNKVVIVHGQDDSSCSVIDKITIFQNMIKAGFRPSGYFLAPSDIDGTVITTAGHAVGDRLQVIQRYAGCFLEENGAFSAKNNSPTDFEKGGKVEFPCTGGKYIVDFSELPVLTWQKSAGINN